FADALRPLRDLADVRLPLMPSRVLSLIGEAGGLAEPAPPAGLGRTAEPPRVAGGLALQAQGSVDIAAPPEKEFAVLLDPAALARVLPGCHALQRDGEHRYRADVTVGVGLVKARYEARIELSEIDAPRSLRLAGSGQSSLGTGSGSGTVRLEATAAGTRLHYDYAAQVGGKVAAVGSRMLEGAARIVLAQLFESLGRQAAGD
ncbi:carbon monoxide dehydrogenase subunit G, partial [Myxococcota bacterium]|nr:carbon monoxide dehydrogenase subunit G [Myxococcota bacterium]